MRQIRPWALMVIALVLGGACSVECTLIGCASGLYIDFDKASTYPYRVELTSGANPSQTFVQDCPSSQKCSPTMAYFEGYFPSVVTVKVTTPSGTATKQVEPKYEEHFPNGKRCGPACTSAHIAVTLP